MRDWRGAALAHHLKTSRYSWQGADLSRHRVKQAAPGNGLAHRSSIARIGVTKSLGLQLPLAQTVNDLLTEADAKGWSQQDFAVASNLVRDQG